MVVDNKATLTYVELIKEDLAIFRLVPEDGKVPDFRAGQFITLGMANPSENNKMVRRAYSIESVRLVSDIYNVDKDFFIGGSLSSADSVTVTLGTPLPNKNSLVKIAYTPLSSNGDRLSIYKDSENYINFFIKASGTEYKVSTPISWDRNTWHRIMVMWKTNSTNSQDRLRLFVDGTETGVIKYGTGLVYGTGVIYGQAEVRANVNRFIVDDIDMLDTFSRITIGSDVLSANGANALMDNIRFSDTERLNSIKTVGNSIVDLNYTSNSAAVNPVVEDGNTTAIYNFDRDDLTVEFLSTIINTERGIFRFQVDVIDSFNKLSDNQELKDLLVKLVNTIKPANSESIINFID